MCRSDGCIVQIRRAPFKEAAEGTPKQPPNQGPGKGLGMRGTAQSDRGPLAAPINPVLWGFADTPWRDGLLVEREQTEKKGWVGEEKGCQW